MGNCFSTPPSAKGGERLLSEQDTAVFSTTNNKNKKSIQKSTSFSTRKPPPATRNGKALGKKGPHKKLGALYEPTKTTPPRKKKQSPLEGDADPTEQTEEDHDDEEEEKTLPLTPASAVSSSTGFSSSPSPAQPPSSTPTHWTRPPRRPSTSTAAEPPPIALYFPNQTTTTPRSRSSPHRRRPSLSSSSSSSSLDRRPQKGADTSTGADQPRSSSNNKDPPPPRVVSPTAVPNSPPPSEDQSSTIPLVIATPPPHEPSNNSNNSNTSALLEDQQSAVSSLDDTSSQWTASQSAPAAQPPQWNQPNPFAVESQPPQPHAEFSPDPFGSATNHEDDFEASLHQSLIWAQLDTSHPDTAASVTSSSFGPPKKDAIGAVALSSSSSSSFQSHNSNPPPMWQRATPPPLYLAVGTESGQVLVTQVLPEDEQPPALSAWNHQDTKKRQQRLGPICTLQRQGRIRSLDFSVTTTTHDHTSSCWLACGGDDGTCVIWSVQKDQTEEDSRPPVVQVVAEIPRVDRIYAVRFRPNGQSVAIGGYEETVAMVDLLSKRVVTDVPVVGLVSTLEWSPDSTLLAIGGWDKVCTVIHATTHKVVHQWKCPAAVTSVEWHPQGQVVAIGCACPQVLVVDRVTGNVLRQVTLEDSPSQPVLGSQHRRSHSLGGTSSSTVRIQDLCWSPGTGQYLVVCTRDSSGQSSTTKLLDTKSFSTIQELSVGGVNSVVWGQAAPTSLLVPPQYLVVGGSSGKALVLKAGLMHHSYHEGSCRSSSYHLGSTTSSSCALSSSFGEDHSSTNRRSNYPSPWPDRNDDDKAEEEEDWMFLSDNVFRTPSPRQDEDFPWQPRLEHASSSEPWTPHCLATVAFSRGSKSRRSAFFAVASADHASVTVRSTNHHTNHPAAMAWHPLCQLDFLNPMTCLAFSNGSRLLACASHHNGHVHIVATAPSWTVVTVATVPGTRGIQTMAFSKNNERLAVLGTDGMLRLLNPQTEFQCCLVLGADSSADGLESSSSSSSSSTCFDWSSKVLVMGHEDGAVCVYRSVDVLGDDTVSNHHLTMEAAIVARQPTPVRAVAIGPSSRFLAVGGDDGTLTVFCRTASSSKHLQDHHQAGSVHHHTSAPENKDTWIMVHQVSTIDFSIASLKWSPSGRHIAVMGQGKQLKVIDTVFWSEVAQVTQFSSDTRMNHFRRSIGSVSFSQDGQWMALSEDPDDDDKLREPSSALARSGGKIRIWSTLTWDLVLRVPLLAEETVSDDEEFTELLLDHHHNHHSTEAQGIPGSMDGGEVGG